jgi:hypothetical protein
MSKYDMMLYKNTQLFDYTPKTRLNCERYKVSNIQNNENSNLGNLGTKINLNASFLQRHKERKVVASSQVQVV